MATNIVIALCEGPHDVSFITKILKSDGFKSSDHLKIIEFPAPISGLMIQEVVKTDVEELNLQEIRKGFLPVATLQKGESFIFLYSMGGDGKQQSRKYVLNSLALTVRQVGEIRKERIPDDSKLSVLYFFDADIKGVSARLSELNTEVRQVITSIKEDIFTANSTHHIKDGIKLGCFIFTGLDNNTGKLEDILVPLMKDGNDNIFDEATIYLQNHFEDDRLFPLKLSSSMNIMNEARSTKAGDKYRYDEKKSILGVVGQLQKSGKSNTVCISDTDYLTLTKIQNCQKCQEIITFIDGVINGR